MEMHWLHIKYKVLCSKHTDISNESKQLNEKKTKMLTDIS